MEAIIYKSVEFDDVSVNTRRLNYVVLVNEKAKNQFGIAIEREMRDGCIEIARSTDICDDINVIRKFADILSRNSVMPVHLNEIADDYFDIGEQKQRLNGYDQSYYKRQMLYIG